VLAATEVSYKLIAPIDQNDLEFLIPADNDTYIDLVINQWQIDIVLGKECGFFGPNARDK